MAPSQFSINDSDQAPNSSCSDKSSAGCGRSKAQMCLQKILHTILTIRPKPITPNEPSSISSRNDTRNEDESVIADLNVDNLAVPAPQTEDRQIPSVVADEGSEDEKAKVAEEIKNGFCERNNEVINFDREDQGQEDCMGMLVEAAKMMFGEFKTEERQKILEDFDVSTANTRPKIRRKHQRWTPVDLYVDMEPVVRSKRGRTRVLPGKFRDSVLEPLTRVSRNRSTVSATKRRLR